MAGCFDALWLWLVARAFWNIWRLFCVKGCGGAVLALENNQKEYFVDLGPISKSK